MRLRLALDVWHEPGSSSLTTHTAHAHHYRVHLGPPGNGRDLGRQGRGSQRLSSSSASDAARPRNINLCRSSLPRLRPFSYSPPYPSLPSYHSQTRDRSLSSPLTSLVPILQPFTIDPTSHFHTFAISFASRRLDLSTYLSVQRRPGPDLSQT